MEERRICGNCAHLLGCLGKSSENYIQKATGLDLLMIKSIPACKSFTKIETPKKEAAELIARIRDLAHEETRSGRASPFIVASLELANQYEKLDRLAEECSRAIEEIGRMIEVAR